MKLLLWTIIYIFKLCYGLFHWHVTKTLAPICKDHEKQDWEGIWFSVEILSFGFQRRLSKLNFGHIHWQRIYYFKWLIQGAMQVGSDQRMVLWNYVEVLHNVQAINVTCRLFGKDSWLWNMALNIADDVETWGTGWFEWTAGVLK